jgi:phosphate starvation-inducible PhoH-like protein
MGRSGKKKRLYDMYLDDIEDEVFYINTIKNHQNSKIYNKPPSSLLRSYNDQYIHPHATSSYKIQEDMQCNMHNKNQGKMQNKIQDIMKPRNSIQDIYIKQINNDDVSIVLATGPAGTGKSCIAVSAAIDLFKKGKYERIVITRPAVTVDEEHGFLPGKIEDKLDPWVRPLYDTFYKYYTPDEVKAMIANKIIDICPLAYLRGRTLEDSFIIVDEAQNCSVKQMLMTLTRIGNGSKMIITGDPSQHDRGYEKSGLTDLIERLYRKNINEIKGIAHIQFTAEHVERHPIIKHVLILYE